MLEVRGQRGCLFQVTRLLRHVALSIDTCTCIYKHTCMYGQAGEEDGR